MPVPRTLVEKAAKNDGMKPSSMRLVTRQIGQFWTTLSPVLHDLSALKARTPMMPKALALVFDDMKMLIKKEDLWLKKRILFGLAPPSGVRIMIGVDGTKGSTLLSPNDLWRLVGGKFGQRYANEASH